MNFILSWLTGGGFKAIAQEIADWDLKRREAANDADRIAAEVQIAMLQAEMQAATAAKEVRLAMANQWEVRLMVFTAGFPPALHFAAVCFASLMKTPWIVHKLPPPMDEWQGAIILSFFGLTAVGTGLRALAMWRRG